MKRRVQTVRVSNIIFILVPYYAVSVQWSTVIILFPAFSLQNGAMGLSSEDAWLSDVYGVVGCQSMQRNAWLMASLLWFLLLEREPAMVEPRGQASILVRFRHRTIPNTCQEETPDSIRAICTFRTGWVWGHKPWSPKWVTDLRRSQVGGGGRAARPCLLKEMVYERYLR